MGTDENGYEEPLVMKEDKLGKHSDYSQSINRVKNSEAVDGIAIIGISGFFPGSDSIDDFCQKIENQESLLTNVPDNHFPQKNVVHRYGAFLDDIAGFDAELFNIGALEAKYMDPRTRQLLMSVWHTLEDACYPPSQLSNSRVDVHIASEGAAYSPFLSKADISAYSILGTMSWTLPNYISHAFRFKGKSLFVDTACTGGSVALHQAMQSLAKDEADYAIVGASNLLFGDTLAGAYLGQESLGILSNIDCCHPFQQNAMGFLPAEATVTVLLKKCSQAIRDRDNIYGVLLGSHVNHVGGYGTLTMPSAESQSNAIVQAYRNAAIDPATVTYIEAHAASSLLADSEEINAFKLGEEKLKNDFEFSTDQSCKISTIKPNIGHANSVSGLISLTRVLHSFKIGKKLGVKNFSTYSDKIDLSNTRFYVNEKTESWERLTSTNGEEIPRRAAINNFGAGGVNVHILMEEYMPSIDDIGAELPLSKDSKIYFLALSAKNAKQLVEYAISINDFLEKNRETCERELEYFYLTARHFFNHRVVLRYKSIENLREVLKKFIESDGQKSYYLKNNLEDKDTSIDMFRKYPQLSDFLQTLNRDTDKNILAELWVYGIESPITQFYKKAVYCKRSFPKYPFNKEKFWIKSSSQSIERLIHKKEASVRLHPLLHNNTSNFEAHRFSSFFTGNEFFLKDHVIQGQKVLPGVAHVEMARAAVALAASAMEHEGLEIRMKNIAWIRPLVVGNQGLQVNVTVVPEESGWIAFKIYSEYDNSEATPIVFSQGYATLSPAIHTPALDINVLKNQCNKNKLSPEQCYEFYQKIDIFHGPSLQGIEVVYGGENEALARLILPSSVIDTQDQFVLHPSLMDSASQVAASLMVGEDSPDFGLPFALEELEIIRPCTTTMWVWARYRVKSSEVNKVQKFDFDLCDDDGNVCIRVKGCSSRMMGSVVDSNLETTSTKAVLKSELTPKQSVLEECHNTTEANSTSEVSNDFTSVNHHDIRSKIESFLRKSIGELLNLKPQKVDLNTELNNLGLDSIALTDFSNQLNRKYMLQLLPTIFFEYPTLADFVEYLLKEHKSAFVEKVTNSNIKHVAQQNEELTKKHVIEGLRTKIIPPQTAKNMVDVRSEPFSNTDTPLAVVGISGRFPMADNLNEFWDNLKAGRDCISEIPRDRWDWKELFGDPIKEPNKTNVKWGGFIDGIDEFDPLFFGISPKEAQLMDPQQRLMMTYIWQVIEDAGYSAEALSGSSTGIFIGTGMSGYGGLVTEAKLPIEGYTLTGLVPSVGPNRMSFFLNWHGPSEPIETSCSSSLVAIHRAVHAIEKGDCDQAVVGGVNSLIVPDGYISFSKAGMLCEDGRCKSFSSEANGYVRGEGVGMLFLKKLDVAENANDHIYGLIRGSAENHGGRANSLTAPNPNAQASLLKSVYAKTGVDPRSVGYIEAHGTGTPLGDPVEINALKSAFKDLYQLFPATETEGEINPHCGVGSVKSNIGHLEMAAGIAGVIKVLLQLKHKTLVKSLHSESLNQYIQLKGSPFYVIQENREWEPLKDSSGKSLPRRAGVSSFGFGGSNAHVVFEEYMTEQKKESQITDKGTQFPGMIVLSAKNDKQLKQLAQNLLSYLSTIEVSQPVLSDVAYTLQVGREAMDERLGFIVETVDELTQNLNAYLDGNDGEGYLYRGEVKRNRDILASFTADDDIAKAIEGWVRKGKYSKLMDLWVKGFQIDWESLYGDYKPNRISLPTYPFAKDRYWIGTDNKAVPSNLRSHLLTLPASEPNKAVDTYVALGDDFNDEMTYITLWEEQSEVVSEFKDNSHGNILIVFSENSQEFEKTIQAFYFRQENYSQLIQVRLSEKTERRSNNVWFCGVNDVDGFKTCLKTVDNIDCVYFISKPVAPSTIVNGETLFKSQQECEIQLLRLVKLLQQKMSKDAFIDLIILTQDNYSITKKAVSPYGGGVTGLAYSIAQGDHRFLVRNIDLSFDDLLEKKSQKNVLRLIQKESASDRASVVKFKSGRRYKQEFFALDWDSYKLDTGIKKAGVYVILGGSGVVGTIVTRYLMHNYQAKVVWLGRQSEMSDAIQEKLRLVNGSAERPLYIQADVTDLSSLKEAVIKIKKKYSTITGAIFSGVVFNSENSVSQTSEDDFWDTLDVKTKGSFNFYQAFHEESLDFMCYFSSSQAFSFSGAAKLSAYAAGITSSDSLIRSIQHTSAFPVGIINWGFWETSLSGLNLNQSVNALSDIQGFTCFERFTCALQDGVTNQILCLNASQPVKQLMNINQDETISLCRQSLPIGKYANE